MSLLLFWNQFAPGTPIDGGCSLYVYGQDVLDKGGTLYIAGRDALDDVFPCIINGHIQAIKDTSLFIFGRGELSTGIPLYLKIRDPAIVEMVRYIKPEDLLNFVIADRNLSKVLATSPDAHRRLATSPADPRYIKPEHRDPRYVKPIDRRGISGEEVVFSLRFTQE